MQNQKRFIFNSSANITALGSHWGRWTAEPFPTVPKVDPGARGMPLGAHPCLLHAGVFREDSAETLCLLLRLAPLASLLRGRAGSLGGSGAGRASLLCALRADCGVSVAGEAKSLPFQRSDGKCENGLVCCL